MTSPITTHVLDTAAGRPAAGLKIRLELLDENGKSSPLGEGRTDCDGRLGELMPATHRLAAGSYRLHFDTGAYYRALGQPTFYPSVTVAFAIVDPTQHYHVPLLLSPYGYSTYRGS